MNKEDFNLIMKSLSDRIQKCEEAFSGIETTEDLLKLPLEEVIELATFCKKEYVDMTKIAMVDFYHIIGMGNLTPPQMTKFTFAMQDYLKYRPDVNNIATNLDSIMKLPQLPTKTKFRLLALCNLTLTKNVRPDEEDEVEYEDLETVETYREIHKNQEETHTNLIHHDVSTSTDPVFVLNKNTLTVEKSKLVEFFNQVAPAQAYFSVFKNKVETGRPALGIDWKIPEETDCCYVGTVSSKTKESLVKKFNLEIKN